MRRIWMAGTPKKMAGQVAELEELAFDLSTELFVLAPTQYRRRETNDELGTAWNVCIEATIKAMNAMESLGDLLRAKVCIKGPGPIAELVAEYSAELDPTYQFAAE